MRNKRLAAGSHLLPPHVVGAWSYGFRHYPHGPHPAGHSSRCPAGEWMSQIHRQSSCTAQMQISQFRNPIVPPDSGFASLFALQPVLAAAGLCPRQPRLPATGDCGARFGDFKNLANMAPPLSVPKEMGGVNAMLPLFHKTTKRKESIWSISRFIRYRKSRKFCIQMKIWSENSVAPVCCDASS